MRQKVLRISLYSLLCGVASIQMHAHPILMASAAAAHLQKKKAKQRRSKRRLRSPEQRFAKRYQRSILGRKPLTREQKAKRIKHRQLEFQKAALIVEFNDTLYRNRLYMQQSVENKCSNWDSLIEAQLNRVAQVPGNISALLEAKNSSHLQQQIDAIYDKTISSAWERFEEVEQSIEAAIKQVEGSEHEPELIEFLKKEYLQMLESTRSYLTHSLLAQISSIKKKNKKEIDSIYNDAIEIEKLNQQGMIDIEPGHYRLSEYKKMRQSFWKKKRYIFVGRND